MKVVFTNNKNKFIKKVLDKIALLKEHKKKIFQFRLIKEVCCIVNDPSMKAVALRMDGSENAKLFQCHQEKSNYYFDIHVSVNKAVVYNVMTLFSVLVHCQIILTTKMQQYGHR